MKKIKFGILTPSLLMSLIRYGNTVISVERFERAIRNVSKSSRYRVDDENISEIDKREIYKAVLIDEIGLLAGFDVSVTLIRDEKPASLLATHDNPVYLIEKIRYLNKDTEK